MSDTDLDRYRRHIEHFDMPPEAKTDLLRSVWRIMQSFVDPAFGDDPVQHLRGNSEAASPNLADNLAISDAQKAGGMLALGSDPIHNLDEKLAGAFRSSAKGKAGRR